MNEIADIDDRPQPRDPATLLPRSYDTTREEGYIEPASHIYNDPERAPLTSKLPKSGFVQRA